MKFKKTKLTALAMSVLMAASTITSVTWAADLFTDGAEAEVVVEAPVDVVSEAEEVEIADDETLLSRKLTDTEFFDCYVNSSKQMIIEFYPVYDDTTKGTKQTAVGTPTNDKRSATCEHGEEVVYSYEYDDEKFYTPYEPVIDGQGKQPHVYEYITANDPDIAPSCETKGYTYAYLGCKYCKKAKVSETGDPSGDYRANVSYLRNAWTNDPTPEKEKDVVTDSNTGIKIKRIELAALGHSWGDVYNTVVPLVPVKDTDGKISFYEEGEANKTVADYEKVANCKIVNGVVTGPLDNDQDAFYYQRQKCNRSGCRAFNDLGKKPLYYANMNEKEVICVAGENVEGFVYVDSNGFLKKWPGSKENGYDSTKIPRDKFVAAVLKDCEKPGSYDIVSQSIDEQGKVGHISTETVSVSKGHAFSNVLVSPNSVDGLYLLKDDKASDPDHVYVADYDENKDVVKAYSNNCTKKAKYDLYHYCFSSQCKLNRNNGGETIGAQKITDKGTAHAFVTWEVDNSKTVYTKIDEKQHKEHYIETSKCVRCGATGERDSVSKPDAVKSHTLAPAEIKDSRKEPTCGENGSYNRGYTCACGYVDEDSITTVTIPATDKHDFGTNEAYIQWTGEVYIAGDNVPKRSMIPYVGRKCNICGKIDANGIDGTQAGTVGAKQIVEDDTMFGVVAGSVVDAKKDPATGVTYPCSTAHATLFVNWLGTVDGKVVKLNSSNTTNAVLENVPYYASLKEYEGRTAHHAAPAVRENIVAPTDTAEGSYDEVIYCEVCGDEMSRKTTKVSKLDPAIVLDTPAVLSAESAGYNSVKVTWSAVEGAASYRLYYRGGEATNWTRVKSGIKGTTYTYTSNNLVSGVKYRFTVRAVSGDVLSGYSAKGKVAAPKPAAPTVKSVTFSGKKAAVTWSKVAGANGYIIQRKTTGGWTRVGTVKSGSRVTWTDNKAVSGAAYRVRAYRTVENVNVYGPFSAAK